MDQNYHNQRDASSRIGLKPGSLVGNGRFRLKRFIGGGRIGEVWSAHDNRLHELIALKFILPQIHENKEAMEILRREFLKSRRLSHNNIVRVYDLYEETNHPPFIAMEYVDGINLQQFCLTKPNGILSWDVISPLMRQLVSAIQYAHSQNVIHFEIKPSNLLLNSQHVLKISDFGIGKVARSLAGAGTQFGSHFRVNGFMSPQQARGENASVFDDIYGIGATVYFLLTGTPPFYKGDIEYQILHTKPDPLAERLLEINLTNPIPPILEHFIQACLEKDTSGRPPDAGSIFEWLDRIDREYEEENEKKSISPKRGEGIQVVESRSVESSGMDETRWKSSLPFLAMLIFCSGLLVLSFLMRKPSADTQIRTERFFNSQTNSASLALTQTVAIISDVRDFARNSERLTQRAGSASVQSKKTDIVSDQTKLDRGKLLAEFPSSLTCAVASNEESSWIILADSGGWIRMLDTRSGSVVWEKKFPGAPIKAMMIMPDNRRFVAADGFGNVVVCSVIGGGMLLELAPANEEIVSIATSAGRFLAVATVSGAVRIWDAVSGRFITEIKSGQTLVKKIALSPDGKILATAKQNGIINLYSLPRGELQKSFTAHKTEIAEIYYDSKDYKFYTLGKEDRVLKNWDFITMTETKLFRPQAPLRESFSFMRFSPKMSRAVIVSDQNYGYLIDVGSFVLIKKIKFDIHTRSVTDAVFLPDGRIITVGMDGYVCRWEPE